MLCEKTVQREGRRVRKMILSVAAVVIESFPSSEEKTTFEYNTGRASKNKRSGPENRDASISSCKHMATQCNFRSFSSAAIDQGIGIGSFGVHGAISDFVKKI